MPVYSVQHTTSVSYSVPVAVAWHCAHMRPRESPWQDISGYAFSVTPKAAHFTERKDYFGNWLQQFSIGTAHTELEIDARYEVNVRRKEPVDKGFTLKQLKEWLAAESDEAIDVLEFTHPFAHVVTGLPFAKLAQPFFTEENTLFEGISQFCQFLYEELTFDPEATEISTPVAKVLELKRGVCQDFAHLGIACLRSLGIPAAYISGYLLTNPPAGQPRLVGADASHAWISVALPDGDWLDLDPTNGCLPWDRHILVARGRDYSDVSPLHGAVTGGGEQTLEVGVTVLPDTEKGTAISMKKPKPTSRQ